MTQFRIKRVGTQIFMIPLAKEPTLKGLSQLSKAFSPTSVLSWLQICPHSFRTASSLFIIASPGILAKSFLLFSV